MAVTSLHRRLKKLETQLTDPSGLVPHTQKWLEYWDRQHYLFLTDQDKKALQYATVEVLHAMFKYMDDPASLAGSIPGLHGPPRQG